MRSSTSSSNSLLEPERESSAAVPDLRRALVTALILCAVFLGSWEAYVRARGYIPTLNDNSDLWVTQRNAVQSDSMVIVGSSRVLFDLDLDVLQAGLGKRPIQLALVGSSAFPILEDLAKDEGFAGTVICGIVPALYFAPAGPPMEKPQGAVERRGKQTPAQAWSQAIGIRLQERFAFIQQEDLTLRALLNRIPMRNRTSVRLPPALPPWFSTIDRDRRTRMIEACARPGPLQARVKEGWFPLFTPPPPPPDVPHEAFMEMMRVAFEKRFADSEAAVAAIRARGGKVVFVRCPSDGPLLELEDQFNPRAAFWDELIRRTGAPGIYFLDYPELSGFQCPEYSHLSAEDSVRFTQNLVPHLQRALGLSTP